MVITKIFDLVYDQEWIKVTIKWMKLKGVVEI